MYVRIARAFLHLLCFFPVSVSVLADTVRSPDGNQGTGALGRIEPRSRVIKVSHNAGPEGARVEQLFFAEGDQVKSGDILAILADHGKKTAEVEAAGTRIKVLKAQRETERIGFDFNQKEHSRYQSLKQDSMASISLADAKYLAFAQSAANLKQLSAEIAHAEAEQRIAVEALKNTRIHAPMSGTVVALEAREGQTLNATYQTPNLLRIADLSRMTVWTEVSEADVGRIYPGMPVYFTTLGLRGENGALRRWIGTLRQILPAPPSSLTAPGGGGGQNSVPAGKVVLYTALFDVDNTDGALMPQMSTQVFFVASAAHDVLVAPMASLEPLPDKPGTFFARVLEGQHIRTREVEIGIRDRLYGEILSGLAEHDQIVTSVKRTRVSERLRW